MIRCVYVAKCVEEQVVTFTICTINLVNWLDRPNLVLNLAFYLAGPTLNKEYT